MSIQGSEIKAGIADCWAITRSKIVKFSHVWTIENYSFHEKNEVIVSPPFSASENDATQWCLKLFPRGDMDEGREFVSIYLSLSSSETDGVPARYKISILDDDKKAIKTMQNEEPMRFRQGEDFGFAKFIPRDFVLDDCDGCLPQDELTVHCEVTALAEAQNISGRKCSEHSAKSPQGPSNRAERQRMPEVALQLQPESVENYLAMLARENHGRAAEIRKKIDQVNINSLQSANSMEAHSDTPLTLPQGNEKIKLSRTFAGNTNRPFRGKHQPEKNGSCKLQSDLAAAVAAVDDVIRDRMSGGEFLGEWGRGTSRIRNTIDQIC